MRKITTRLLALCLAVITLFCLIPAGNAASNWNMEYFLKKYSDPHFNLQNEPNRAMTVEEFIGIVYAYSYYGDGNANVTCRDKNGKAPSAWCAPYVQAEVSKGVVTPEDVSWTQPVTLAFAAQYLSRAKGKYSYDAHNLYSFRGTEGLGPDDVLYLSTAVDHGLISYTPNMDVSKAIARKDARKYEVPTGTVTCKPAATGSSTTMRENHVYFVDCYWDLDKAADQLRQLIYSTGNITMVTFQSAYLNADKAPQGNRFFYCSTDHAEAVKYNPNYTRDPEIDAIEYCLSTGKLAFLGVSNAENNAFSDSTVRQMLASAETMDTAVAEIVSEAEKHGVSGVNMGIELPESAGDLRTAYGSFLRKLSAALHSRDMLLLVTVGAYFTEAQEEKSFYDYSAVNEVADYVHVILYDDYNDTGYPWRKTDGAISNLTRIGRCLRYAAAQIDSGKILLGTGNFAIDFNKTSLTAQDITHKEAEAMRWQKNAQLQWDSTSAGCFFDYTDENGECHRVWTESTDSIAARAALVKQYDLCGFSTYYLSSNAPELYAEETKISSFYPEVFTAIHKKLVPNHLRNHYSRPITRAEFCDMIAAFIPAITGKSAVQMLHENGLVESSFTDCSTASVKAAGGMGIVTGYPDGSFKPNNTISRQEAATMLTRLAKFCGLETPNAESVPFAELSTMQTWAKDGVAFISACEDKLTGKRVMGGTGAFKFSPLSSYTREQSAMTMIRLFNVLDN